MFHDSLIQRDFDRSWNSIQNNSTNTEEEVNQILNILHIMNTSYHSQCIGIVKCFNSTLKHTVKLCKGTPLD